MKSIILALTLLALAGCGESRVFIPHPTLHTHIVNPGAKVEITENAPMPEPGIIGLFYHDHEHIEIAGPLTPEAYVLLHEYEHLIEQRLIEMGDYEGAILARDAFRDLNAGDFEIGNADLLKRL